MAQYGFYFNSNRCTGCRTCTMACKDFNDLSQIVAFRKVYDYEGGTTVESNGEVTTTCYAYHVSEACNHCDSPACVANCPQASMQKDPETGLVYNDPETCIGCGTCATSCPYGVPTIDTEAKKSVKCDGCRERVAAGKAPICVEACPLRSLEFGEIEALRAAHPGCDADIAPLADPAITGPNLIVDKCSVAQSATAGQGFVGNQNEIDGVAARELFNEYSIA